MTETLAPLWQAVKVCAGCDEPHRLPPGSIYCGHCQPPGNVVMKAYRRHHLKNLRELRLRQGMSQEKLAYISGVTRVSISAFEIGRRFASTTTTEKLAAALMVTIEDLEG